MYMCVHMYIYVTIYYLLQLFVVLSLVCTYSAGGWTRLGWWKKASLTHASGLGVCMCVFSCVRLFATLWTVALQVPLTIAWNFPDKNTGVCCRFLLQELHPCLLCLLCWQVDSLRYHHLDLDSSCQAGHPGPPSHGISSLGPLWLSRLPSTPAWVFCSMDTGFQLRERGSCQASPKVMSTAGTMVLLPSSVGQSKSQDQLKRRGNGFHSWWEERQERRGRDCWQPSLEPISHRVSQRCGLIRIGPLGLFQQLNELLFPRQQSAHNEVGIPWSKTPNQTNQCKEYSEF